MPGLTDWFDVFRCGTHTDRFGRTVNISTADIDQAITAYKSDSAPIVVGHPSLNAPAFGWVGAFRRVGNTVQARASVVADEFADLVKRNLYKNRSLSFGPGLRFRHVGFLGAQAPAVKGLADIQFAQQEDYMTVDFADSSAENPNPPALVAQEPATKSATKPEVTPEEADTSELDALKADLEAVKAELASIKAEKDHCEAKLKDERAKARNAENSAWIEKLGQTGRLPQDKQKAVTEFMACLGKSETYEFASGEEPILQRFKGLLNDILRPAADFSEFACAQRTAVPTHDSQELAKMAQQYIDAEAAKGHHVSASEAVTRFANKGVKTNE